jgi:trigger factor
LAHDHDDVKVAVEEVEACKRKLAVEAPADVVQQEWERAYGRVQKQARLPGFRKGHVPRSLVKLHFADDVRREVAEHLIPDIYRRAVSDAHLDPVNEPDLQDVRLEEGAPLSFTAVVEIKPTITLADYTGLDIEHPTKPVTSGDIDETVEQMREQHAQFQSVDRPANPGDLVIVDYTLTPEGQDPHTETGYAFLTGSGSVMAEIDQAVVGMRAGEEREVGVRFADDHRNEALKGRSGRATVKVVEVKEKILPVVDDEFAKGLGAFDTLEAVREEIKKQLETQRTRQERVALEDKIIETLLLRHEFAVPKSLIMRQITHQVEHARERMRRQGMDPDATQWDFGKIVAELTPGAEKAVRRSLLLEAIAAREGLAPADADVETEIEKIAQASQRPAPAVRRMMEKSGDLDALRHGLRERMTFDFLVQHAAVRG